jgi:molecular chaperone DnaK (HSP70)
VSFKKGGLAVRCHSWDRDLGGRDLDELLYDHFCKEIMERFKLDVRNNAKASFKLRTQCERLKKVWLGPGLWTWQQQGAVSTAAVANCGDAVK